VVERAGHGMSAQIAPGAQRAPTGQTLSPVETAISPA
jgi:hypothetical protein